MLDYRYLQDTATQGFPFDAQIHSMTAGAIKSQSEWRCRRARMEAEIVTDQLFLIEA